MSAKGFKRMLLGEKMPDKNDPQYMERYEKDVAAGRKFARWSRLDKVAVHVQQFADNHRNAFLVMVFGFVALSIGYNVYRLTCVYNHPTSARSVVEVQDSVLKAKRHGAKPINNYNYEHRRD